MESIAKYPNRWTAGVSGNLNGRPIGSRTAFSHAFLRDLAETWAEHGKATMVHTAKTNPQTYFAVCARLIPADVQLTIEQTRPALDLEDMQVLRAIRESIPNAGERSPQDVLQFTLDAIRAHSGRLIEQPSVYETASGDNEIDD